MLGGLVRVLSFLSGAGPGRAESPHLRGSLEHPHLSYFWIRSSDGCFIFTSFKDSDARLKDVV